MTATGVEAGSCRAPNTCQRNAVSASIDQPWIRLSGDKAVTGPHTSATTMSATASRRLTLAMAAPVIGLSRSLHPHQAADDRRSARRGRLIDQEDGPSGAE